MHEKRMRKMDSVLPQIAPPQLFGEAQAEVTLLGWGSTEGVIREAIEKCDAALRPWARFSLLEELARSEETSQMHRTEIGQPSIFAMQGALVLFENPALFAWAQRLGRVGQVPLERDGRIDWLPDGLSGWTESRDMPALPPQSFRAWWRQRTREGRP